VIAIPVPDEYKKVEDLENEENLGTAVPTGSKVIDPEIFLTYLLIEWWKGWLLLWTCHLITS
jgi:hypothetical protein